MASININIMENLMKGGRWGIIGMPGQRV